MFQQFLPEAAAVTAATVAITVTDEDEDEEGDDEAPPEVLLFKGCVGTKVGICVGAVVPPFFTINSFSLGFSVMPRLVIVVGSYDLFIDGTKECV